MSYPDFVLKRIAQMVEWSNVSEEDLYERYDALYAVTRGGNRARLTIRALVAQLEEEITMAKEAAEAEPEVVEALDSEPELGSEPESEEEEPEPDEEEEDLEGEPEDGEDETDVYKEAIKAYIGDVRHILTQMEEFLE